MRLEFAIRTSAAVCALAALAVPVQASAGSLAADSGPRHVAAGDSHRGSVAVAGPTLTAFNAAATVDAGKDGAQLKVTLSATDAGSDLSSVMVSAESPDGQRSSFANAQLGFPSNTASTTLGLGFGVYSQPGTWTITQVVLSDYAGNTTIYDQARLAALGNASFTVTNTDPRAIDLTPPTLVSGSILTPGVSLTPGANFTDTWAGIQLKLADAGNPAPSGLFDAQVEFCMLDYSHCFNLYWGSYLNGQAKVAPKFGTNLANQSGSVVDGTYYLNFVSISDIAGNVTTMFSTKFGGSTDFSTYFRAGQSITVSN